MSRVRVGIIDSGVTGIPVAGSRSFLAAADGGVFTEEAFPDRLGHGSTVAGVIAGSADDCALFSAQVFAVKLTCRAAQVAVALNWLVEQEVQLVNMSFGLREDRPVLREACESAMEQGVTLVAAAPARGEPVYPAAYPGVIRATGDARCREDEISALDTVQADFGGNVCVSKSGVAGASVGCAHVTARIARALAKSPGASTQQIRVWLSCMASYRGPERRAG